MRQVAVFVGIVGVVCSAPAIQAQQPQGKPPGAGMMLAMDSLDHRLDSLVSRMNRTSGNQKISAMAAVINELVAQRKVMHRHMQQMDPMMDEKRGMGRMAPPSDTTRPRGSDSER
jgi:hypothetical protein